MQRLSQIRRVQGSGAGIAEQDIEGIFQLFFQGKSAIAKPHAGLGIGLSVVQRLVELHGGRLRARSDEPGTGAEFSVELPLQSSTGKRCAPLDVPVTSAWTPVS